MKKIKRTFTVILLIAIILVASYLIFTGSRLTLDIKINYDIMGVFLE